MKQRRIVRMIAAGAALLLPLQAAGFAAQAGDVRDGVSFHEQGITAGINSSYEGDWEFMTGGGAAAFDCNADGFADLFLAGGTAPAKFYRNTSKSGGSISFAEEKSGLELESATGAYPLDVDSDGIMDLAILRVGENVLMRGLGNCKFERANEAWKFDGGDAWSVAFSAMWEKGAAWPTLAVGNYIDRHEEISPWGSCTDNWLHRPAAGQKAFDKPYSLKPSFCALSMLFTDWGRTGFPDLRVSNDREYYEGGQEQMWRIRPGEEPRLYTDKEGWKYLRIWGMGIASYDVDFDGYPEYALTSMADNKLQTLAEIPPGGNPKPTFKDVAYAKGLTAHRPYMGGDWRPSTAWHTQFEDVNNDGLADLFIAKGNVAKMPDFASRDPNNLLLQKPDGKFVEAGGTAGVGSMAISRGGALADFNLDGLIDIVVVNRWENAQLWRNTTRDAGHWMQFRLEQDGTNRDGIGAWIEVKHGDGKVMRREITVGGGQASGILSWHHFGLGSMEEAEVRTLWPDGTAGEWQKLKADAFYVMKKGAAAAAWRPER